MTRVLLAQPWLYHDIGRNDFDPDHEWRNGPYSLLLLAAQLKKVGHAVEFSDLHRDLIGHKGDLSALKQGFRAHIQRFRPDIIGISFFSIHWFEVREMVEVARDECERLGLATVFVAGGIHATTVPEDTIENLGFDIAFMGEGDIGFVKLAAGEAPDNVPGAYTATNHAVSRGESVENLDDLPFADWSLSDHEFYAHPTYARMKIRKTSSVDLIMGRGCVYKCAFCAYYALSPTRFYSAEYLIENVKYLRDQFGIRGFYFTDSTIGNNRRLIEAFSEALIREELSDEIEWYANIRPNQVTGKLLKLMWRSGCRYLFYGFESGNQRVLDLMVKDMKVEASYKAAEFHRELGFPYHGSFILGYPGETEVEIWETLRMIERIRPPSIGVNWYVPLPGTPDYDKLRSTGVISHNDPKAWRFISESNEKKVFCDIPEQRFRELFDYAKHLAYCRVPKLNKRYWNHLPSQMVA
jgi:anaerobic magnesium-protoporphyrin IX monomethyl ester cyclase